MSTEQGAAITPQVVTEEKKFSRSEVDALLAQVDLTRAPAARPIARREFTDGEREILRESYAAKATPAEFENLIAIASNLGLDPFKRQCHFVKRRQKIDDQFVDMWAVQVGIDGFRAKAEETGLYAGQDEPEFDYDDKGNLLCARVRVYRHGWARPAVGVAYFKEFAQNTSMWTKMPHNQLAKCAEAQAHRKATPALNGAYAPEELGSAEGADNGAKAGGRPAVMRRPAVPTARPTPTQEKPAQRRAAPPQSATPQEKPVMLWVGKDEPRVLLAEATDEQITSFIGMVTRRLDAGKVEPKYVENSKAELAAARAEILRREAAEGPPESGKAETAKQAANEDWGG